mmetsp:Transcript_104307/g.331762  ORF Transcript_104307/g.331762 Transcript_104307/m.331762 type:complete len:589 (+) Transcript_104307:401-2167(+)
MARGPRVFLEWDLKVHLEVRPEALRGHREAAEPAEGLQGGRGDKEQRAGGVGKVRVGGRLAGARGRPRLHEPQARHLQQGLEPAGGAGGCGFLARGHLGARVPAARVVVASDDSIVGVHLGLGAAAAQDLRIARRQGQHQPLRTAADREDQGRRPGSVGGLGRRPQGEADLREPWRLLGADRPHPLRAPPPGRRDAPPPVQEQGARGGVQRPAAHAEGPAPLDGVDLQAHDAAAPGGRHAGPISGSPNLRRGCHCRRTADRRLRSGNRLLRSWLISFNARFIFGLPGHDAQGALSWRLGCPVHELLFQERDPAAYVLQRGVEPEGDTHHAAGPAVDQPHVVAADLARSEEVPDVCVGEPEVALAAACVAVAARAQQDAARLGALTHEAVGHRRAVRKVQDAGDGGALDLPPPRLSVPAEGPAERPAVAVAEAAHPHVGLPADRLGVPPPQGLGPQRGHGGELRGQGGDAQEVRGPPLEPVRQAGPGHRKVREGGHRRHAAAREVGGAEGPRGPAGAEAPTGGQQRCGVVADDERAEAGGVAQDLVERDDSEVRGAGAQVQEAGRAGQLGRVEEHAPAHGPLAERGHAP